jgi:hypothetical protein
VLPIQRSSRVEKLSQSIVPSCQSQKAMLTISVLRRFVPRKHSKKLAPAVSAFSIAVVCLIYARVASTSRTLSGDSLRRRIKLLLARSILSRLTAFHGDSGARYAAMKRGTGQTHCSAKGSRQPRSPWTLTTARTTPEESRIPAPQHMHTYAVT